MKAEKKQPAVTTPVSKKEPAAISRISRGLPDAGGLHFGNMRIQPELMVNQPGDRYEQEADAMADKVMRLPDLAPERDNTSAPAISTLQRKCAHCEEEEQLQRKASGETGLPVISPAVEQALRSPGDPLEPSARSFMEQRFGYDFGQVRIHNDALAHESSAGIQAAAYTYGHHVVFGAGRYRPGSDTGKKLLAHELTHVVQQGNRSTGAVHTANSSTAIIRRSLLSDQAGNIWTTSQKNKDLIFNFLRASAPTADAELNTFIDNIFTAAPDDLWLAKTIMRNGPEPLWPLADIKERQRRAVDNGWAPEPGNIEGILGSGNHTVKAFYFRGVSNRRALIIGGVHGSEPGGVEVVNNLLAMMQQPNAPMPFFSVIIVPELFAANVHSSRPLADRRTSGGKVKAMVGKKAGKVKSPDPNRQFPAIGADPEMNTALGCIVDEQKRCVEPENLVLLDLINRFQPERVASVHGHSPQSREELLKNGGPSITTDPRPGQEKDDDALALSMAQEAKKSGVRIPGNFMGEPEQTTRYPNDTATKISKGVSFGEWGSHGTATRPAMNIILIETFGNTTTASSSKANRASRSAELMNLAQILKNFFLTGPSVLSGPGKPTP